MNTFRLMALMSLLPVVATAQNFSNGFPYFLPPADTGATRFLPVFPRTPLTDQDFVSIGNDGHFSVRGTPTKFFGANFVADGAFPAPGAAWFIAGRFRKMGFNLVRFHHMDNPWSAGSLFVQGASTRALSSATIDRLDNILAELKRNGIYADINLHVGRTFNNLDGIPDADSLQDFGKAINYFDPMVLMLHKEYARELLTHRNPYIGTTLATDPVMAMVEITNENSLYRYWRDGRLKYFSEGGMLTARHTRMLDSLWLSYLRIQYGTTTGLATAWNAGAFPAGSVNLLINGTFESAPPSIGWVMETHPPAAASFMRDSVNAYSGTYCSRVLVSTVDGTDWHLQWKQIGLSVTKDTAYVISFAARSDSIRLLTVILMNDVSPWTGYGWANVTLTPAWQTFTVLVRASETITGTVRLSFIVGGQVGSYWFDNISMITSGVSGLLADESLEAGMVRRIDYVAAPGFTEGRVRDISSFYIKLQDDYFAAMSHFLKDSLGVRVPIVGTNFNVGPADMVVQSKLDYVDNHAYWQHPSFPGIPWSSTDWTIDNTPMVQATDGGTISGLMGAVPATGKPFTISEYNHPFPSRFQSEAPLFLFGYGSFHDADALMFFDYNSSTDWVTDMVANYFSIHRNAAMMSLVPSCAFAFRTQMIAKAKQTYTIDIAPDDYLTLPRRDNSGWTGPSIVDQRLALNHAVRTGSFTSNIPFDPASMPPTPVSPFVSDTREIVWDTKGILRIAAGRFVGLTGFLNSNPAEVVGPLRLDSGSDFGTLTWVSTSLDSLQNAAISLLTVSSKVQNSGMIWDGTTTIHNNWGSSPTQVAPLVLGLTLTMHADSLRVYPLDPSGRDVLGFTTYVPVAPNTFTMTIDQTQAASMWFGIEKFGQGVTGVTQGGNRDLPLEFRLEQNYPNPFNPTTTVRFSLPARGKVTLTVVDILGRTIASLVNEEMSAGIYERTFEASALPSGIYFLRLSSGGQTQARRAVLLR